MDVTKYLENIENDETKEIKEIKEEIAFNKEREKKIKEEIIEKIQVGLFEIETREISDFLQNKYRTIAQGLIKVIANRVIKSTREQL